ncbi:AtpZ/AtpI family protein [Bacteroidota bacterium]
MSEQKNQNSNQKNKKAPSDFAKYSAIGFQMIAIMVIGVLGGMKLDKWITGIEFPVFTVVLTLSSVIFATYYAIKDFIKPQK